MPTVPWCKTLLFCRNISTVFKFSRWLAVPIRQSMWGILSRWHWTNVPCSVLAVFLLTFNIIYTKQYTVYIRTGTFINNSNVSYIFCILLCVYNLMKCINCLWKHMIYWGQKYKFNDFQINSEVYYSVSGQKWYGMVMLTTQACYI